MFNKKKSEKAGEKKLTNKITVKTDADFVGYDGATPFVEFDENWNQMPLDRTKVNIPREHLTRMFPLAYLAGKVSTMEQGSKLGMVAILTLLLLFASIGFTYFTSSGSSESIQAVDDKVASLQNDVSVINQNMQLLKVIAVKMNVSLNETLIPTVGG